MHIPKEILIEINEELKRSSDKQYVSKIQEIKKFQSQYDTVHVKIKRARDLLLDNSLSKLEFDEMIVDLQVEKDNLETKLSHLSEADKEFNNILSIIFTLVSKVHEIFKKFGTGRKKANNQFTVSELSSRG